MSLRSLFFISACLSVVVLYSCRPDAKTVVCPGFNDTTYAAWFPYADSQKMIYKNGHGASDTITIAYATVSNAYLSGAPADSCGSSVLIYSTPDKTNNIKFLTQDYVTASGHDSVSLFFYSLSFTAAGCKDSGLNVSNLAPLIFSETHTNYSFQGKVYSKIQIITTNDTTVTNTSLPWVYRLYLSYGQGIIAYQTFPQKDIWVLQ